MDATEICSEPTYTFAEAEDKLRSDDRVNVTGMTNYAIGFEWAGTNDTEFFKDLAQRGWIVTSTHKDGKVWVEQIADVKKITVGDVVEDSFTDDLLVVQELTVEATSNDTDTYLDCEGVETGVEVMRHVDDVSLIE